MSLKVFNISVPVYFEFPRQMHYFPRLGEEGNSFLLNFREYWASECSLGNYICHSTKRNVAQVLWVMWEYSNMNPYHLLSNNSVGTVLSALDELIHLIFTAHLRGRFYFSCFTAEEMEAEKVSNVFGFIQLVRARAWLLLRAVCLIKPAVLITTLF